MSLVVSLGRQQLNKEIKPKKMGCPALIPQPSPNREKRGGHFTHEISKFYMSIPHQDSFKINESKAERTERSTRQIHDYTWRLEHSSFSNEENKQTEHQ